MRECPVAEKFPVRFIGVLSGGRVSKQIIKNASLSNTFLKIYHVLCHLWRWCLSLFSVSENVLFFHNFQSQYTASVAIQSLVPGGEQTKDPCVIIGNELISAPWECTIAVSTNGHKNNGCPSFSLGFLCYRVKNAQRSRSLICYFLLNFRTATSAISVTFSRAK